MESLQLGEVVVEATGKGLHFAVKAGADSILVESADVPQLLSFIFNSCQETNERRNGYRVPFSGLANEDRRKFQVVLALGERNWVAETIDFSLTGILVRSDISILEEKSVAVRIQNQDETVDIDALVMRRFGDSVLALHFPSALKNGELSPPDTLVAIYRSIELAWLRQRATAK